MYKAVVQAVIMYRSKSWVVTDAMMAVLGGIPSQDFKTDCGDDGAKGRRRGMGMSLSGRGTGGDMDLAYEGLSEEAEGRNRGVCYREADIQYMYRGG